MSKERKVNKKISSVAKAMSNLRKKKVVKKAQKATEVYMVFTLPDRDEEQLGDLIGVYTDYKAANNVRDALIRRDASKELDYNLLPDFESAVVFTRTLNETLTNTQEDG